MAYRVTDTIIVDQSRNLSSIGIATFSGPVVVGVGTSTRLSVTGDVNVSGIVTGSVLVAAKDSGTGIATDSTESIFGNGWRLSAPASTTYYRLATLPAGGAGTTFDHLIINGTLGSWTSNNQTPFEIYFSNRGSFNTKYISYGSVRSDVRILGISTNSTVEIWAQHQASQFTKLVYNITNSLQVIPVNNPVSTTTAPVGTTVFDSSTATPRFIINDSDNVGIGTINPQQKLDVNGYVKIAPTEGNNSVPFGNGTILYRRPDGVIDSDSNVTISNNSDTASLWGLTINSNRIYGSGGSLTLTTQNANGTIDLIISNTDIKSKSNFLPNANNTYDLGSSSNLWRYGYFNGPLFVGSGTSTGTASQPLQVTGGAYVSGNVGIGTASPAFKADIAGDARVTSTNRMRFGGTAGTTNFYIQYNSTANSLDFVAG